ncbi:hypothetical protein FA13DRAFT_1418703 [Coprinellus micaceus]|uniref:CENP-V/GFA domain-containing protein n=1 Tax=Coprinellus micaceus TaxID=71717 RepID=A0A4Y7SNC3_COPMI|nr:hypothetical protein FA13DRAFT_1418703 [Coprinellus micaceus]
MTSRSPTPGPITYVKVACHCGLNELRAGFATDQLPISNDLCHCNTCRHSSGQLAVYHVSVSTLVCVDSDEPFHVDGHGGECPSPDGDGDLVAYRTSENAIRYFCSMCSAHLIFRYLGTPREEGEGGEREGAFWCVAAGALERTEGIVKVGYHIWVEDTLDGGLADHFRTLEGEDLPRYRRGPKSDEIALRWRSETLNQTPNSTNDDTLHISCHCQSNQYKITRPNFESYLPYSAYPDLLHPHDIAHLSKVRNSADVKWWLRPLGSSHPTKYFAGHCTCEYCRKTSGFEIQSWAYVPRSNILDQEGNSVVLQPPEKDEVAEMREELARIGVEGSGEGEKKVEAEPEDPRPKGLKQYISSPGRYREFCRTCGATVFAWQIGRPDLLCIAVGLVDESQAGARAESWFEWCYTRVGYAEQAISPKMVEALTSSLAAAGAEATKSREEENERAPIVSMSLQQKGGCDVVTSVEQVVVAA